MILHSFKKRDRSFIPVSDLKLIFSSAGGFLKCFHKFGIAFQHLAVSAEGTLANQCIAELIIDVRPVGFVIVCLQLHRMYCAIL